MAKVATFFLAMAAWLVFLANGCFIYFKHVIQEAPWPSDDIATIYAVVSVVSALIGFFATATLWEQAEDEQKRKDKRPRKQG